MEKYIGIRYAEGVFGHISKSPEIISGEHRVDNQDIPADAVSFTFIKAQNEDNAKKRFLFQKERLPTHYFVDTDQANISPLKHFISRIKKSANAGLKAKKPTIYTYLKLEIIKMLQMSQDNGCDLCIYQGIGDIQCVMPKDAIVDAKTREILCAPRLKNQR